jgi:hypothetical protein
VSRTEYQRAERCFALARSTKFDGERDNAIRKGTAIAERAGISLDEFDVPGRKRVRRETPGEPLFGGHGIFGDGYSYAVSADGLLREISEMMNASVRQQASVLAEQARRQRKHIQVRSAVAFLKSRGCVVTEYGDGTFSVDDTHSPYARVDGDLIILAAQSRGWRG